MQITCCRGGNAFLLVVDILVYVFINNNKKKKTGRKSKMQDRFCSIPIL